MMLHQDQLAWFLKPPQECIMSVIKTRPKSVKVETRPRSRKVVRRPVWRTPRLPLSQNADTLTLPQPRRCNEVRCYYLATLAKLEYLHIPQQVLLFIIGNLKLDRKHLWKEMKHLVGGLKITFSLSHSEQSNKIIHGHFSQVKVSSGPCVVLQSTDCSHQLESCHKERFQTQCVEMETRHRILIKLQLLHHVHSSFFPAIWLTVILWFLVLIILSQSLLRKLPAYANLDQLKTLENSPWDDSLVHAVENTAAAFLNSSEHAPLERSYLWIVKFWTEGLRR